MFDMEKLVEAVAWLLRKHGGRLSAAKLAKLIYLSDRESMSDDGFSITGDSYCALPTGPAPARLYALMEGTGDDKAQKEWDLLFTNDGGDIAALKADIPFDWLSEFDTDILNAADALFGHMSEEELSSWTHCTANCPEWQDPQGGRLPIAKADILKALGFSEEEIAAVLEEDAIYDAEAQGWERYYKEKEAGCSQ